MNVRKSSYDYYSNYDELNGEGQEENPASFEVIKRYTPDNREEAVMYTRTNDEAAAAGASSHQEPLGDLKRDCDKYLQMILNDVGEDDGEAQPMMIVVIGKTKEPLQINAIFLQNLEWSMDIFL